MCRAVLRFEEREGTTFILPLNLVKEGVIILPSFSPALFTVCPKCLVRFYIATSYMNHGQDFLGIIYK